MTGTKLAKRKPLTPLEYVARERERLLARRGRQSVRALVRRLVREGLDDLAVEVVRVANDRAVVLYGRTVAEERAALRTVLNRLARLVGTFTPAESESVFALLRFVDAWSDEMTAPAASPNVN